MASVLGKNVVIRFFDNGTWKHYACAREGTLTIETEVIETTVSGAGAWATFLPTKNSWTLDLGGVVDLNKTGYLTYADLQQKQIAQTPVLVRLERDDKDGTIMINQGFAIITNSTDTGQLKDMNIFSLSLKGTGALSQTITGAIPPTGPLMRYEYTGTGGEFGAFITALIGKQVLYVSKDGNGNAELITSGTPSSKGVLFDDTTGWIEWAVPFEPGELAVILYQ